MGIKRHIAVDIQSSSHAVAFTTAEVTDSKGGDYKRLHAPKLSLAEVESVLCDSGYTGEPFVQDGREALADHMTVQILKHSGLRKFAVISRRWVVERNFAWLEGTYACGKTASCCSKGFKQILRIKHGNSVLNFFTIFYLWILFMIEGIIFALELGFFYIVLYKVNKNKKKSLKNPEDLGVFSYETKNDQT